jgi:hypothetical protein
MWLSSNVFVPARLSRNCMEHARRLKGQYGFPGIHVGPPSLVALARPLDASGRPAVHRG